jgi:hypothetical protein
LERFAAISGTLLFVLIPIFHCIFSHIFKGKTIKVQFISFFLYLITWSVAWVYYFGWHWSSLISGWATGVFFCLGYMEYFSMVCRGFSLRLLVDIYLRGKVEKDKIVTGYAEGRGAQWLLEKRIHGIADLEFVEYKEQQLKLMPKGKLVAIISLTFKKVLNMGAGG